MAAPRGANLDAENRAGVSAGPDGMRGDLRRRLRQGVERVEAAARGPLIGNLAEVVADSREVLDCHGR